MKKVIFTLMSVVIFLAAIVTAPAQGLLIPAVDSNATRVQAYAWSPDINSLINGTAAFLDALGVPSATVRVLPILIGSELIYNQNLSGVDLNSPFVAAAVSLENLPDGLAYGFSTPGKGYLKNLGQNMIKGADVEEGKILRFGKVIKEFDQEAYDSASVEEQENYEQFFLEESQDIFVAPGDGFTWICADLETIKVVAGKPPKSFDPGNGSGLSLSFSVPTLAETLKEIISVAAPYDPEEGGIDPITIFNRWEVIWDNISTFTLGLTPSKAGVAIAKGMTAIPGSKFADLIAGQKKTSGELVRLLDPGSYIAWDTGIGRTDLMAEGSRALMEAWLDTVFELTKLEEAKEAPLDLDKFKEMMTKNIVLMEKSFQNLGDEMAFSVKFVPEGFIKIVSVNKINDQSKYLELLSESLSEQIASMTIFEGEAVPFKINPDFDGLKKPRQYSGVDVYSGRLAFDWGENEPDVPENMESISTFLKDGFTIEFAVVKNLGIACYQGGKTSGIEGVIDRLQGKAPGLKIAKVPGVASSWGIGAVDYSNILNIMPPEMKEDASMGKVMSKLLTLDLNIPAVALAQGDRITVKANITTAMIKQVIEMIESVEEEQAQELKKPVPAKAK